MNRTNLTVLALTTLTLTGTALATTSTGTSGNSTGTGAGSTATSEPRTISSGAIDKATVTSSLHPAARRVDLDGSGKIDANDLNVFLAAWEQDNLKVCDLDRDGIVTSDDFYLFLHRYSTAISL